MLEGSRQIERMIYPNFTLSIADYPLLNRNVFEAQELESLAFDYSTNSLCYTYIREYNGGWFVDIYYYYASYLNNRINMKRFIIAPVFQILRQDMVVVFMRERSKKNKSLVTIEVGRQEILQVKA